MSTVYKTIDFVSAAFAVRASIDTKKKIGSNLSKQKVIADCLKSFLTSCSDVTVFGTVLVSFCQRVYFVGNILQSISYFPLISIKRDVNHLET